LLRQIFKISPQKNSKGIALRATGTLRQYLNSNEPFYLNTAKNLLEELRNLAVTKFGGIGWGYPFDWQSRIFIPANTPSSVVTAFVGEAFFTYRKITSSNEYDIILKKIGEFILQGLNKTGGCISYTPLDHFQVHNANLFSVQVLISLFNIFGKDEFKKVALEGLNYTINDQGKDGEFYYWDSGDQNNYIDNFHTGYVLRMLNQINKQFSKINLESQIKQGISYYINNLFNDYLPKTHVQRFYPINIHALNEVILVYLELEKYRQDLKPFFDKSLTYLLTQMQYKEGEFAYKRYKHWSVKFPFYRWNQAWTYYTLSKLINELGL